MILIIQFAGGFVFSLSLMVCCVCCALLLFLLFLLSLDFALECEAAVFWRVGWLVVAG